MKLYFRTTYFQLLEIQISKLYVACNQLRCLSLDAGNLLNSTIHVLNYEKDFYYNTTQFRYNNNTTVRHAFGSMFITAVRRYVKITYAIVETICGDLKVALAKLEQLLAPVQTKLDGYL